MFSFNVWGIGWRCCVYQILLLMCFLNYCCGYYCITNNFPSFLSFLYADNNNNKKYNLNSSQHAMEIISTTLPQLSLSLFLYIAKGLSTSQAHISIGSYTISGRWGALATLYTATATRSFSSIIIIIIIIYSSFSSPSSFSTPTGILCTAATVGL